MNKINNDENRIYSIFACLNVYEKSVEDSQNNENFWVEKDGYLINLKDYEFIKRIICFDDLMKISEKYQFDQKLNELESLNILSKIKEINPVIINTTEELIKLIKEKNEYILIDKIILDNILPIQNHQKKICRINVKYFILELSIGEKSIKFYNNKYILNEDSYNICNKNKTLTKISKAMIEYYTFEKMIKRNQKEIKEKERIYLINKNDIDEWKESTNYENIKNNLLKDNYQFNVKYFILELTIGEKSIQFYNNKCILNEDSYNICNKNKSLTKISKAMIEYYTFEKKIKANPKEIKGKERVYLVNKNDIDEWKESTNYENIKNNLLKDIFNIKYLEYEINNQLLNFYKDKKIHVKPIKSLNFKSNKELEDYIKENSLVIVSNNFYDLIMKEEGKEKKEENIYFTSINDLKTIYIGRKEMKFHSNSNILYSIKESYIRIIFKIYYFQEELNNIIKKPIDENKKIKIGLVQKDWIQQLKSYLDYNYLRALINSCEQIKEYNYSSLSDDKIDNLIIIIL